jgi:DNA-binding protein HU-beta
MCVGPCVGKTERSIDDMTKAELLEAVAKRAGVTKTDAERVLDAFFTEVKSTAKNGDKVTWPGFGSFATRRLAARTVANPQDRTQQVQVPASVALKFTASSTLKADLNPTR